MRVKKLLSVFLAASLLFGGNVPSALSCGAFAAEKAADAAIAAEEKTEFPAIAAKEPIKIDSSFFSDDIVEDKNLFLCEEANGIYSIKPNLFVTELMFYDLGTGKTTSVQTFSYDLFIDYFVQGSKLYLMFEYNEDMDIFPAYLKERKVAVEVYDLVAQKTVNLFNVNVDAKAIGVDASGRVYAACDRYFESREEDDNFYIELYSADGELLSSTETNIWVKRFVGFDPTNGCFCYETFEGDFVCAGKVTDDKITVYDKNIPKKLDTPYLRGAVFLGNKYLCCYVNCKLNGEIWGDYIIAFESNSLPSSKWSPVISSVELPYVDIDSRLFAAWLPESGNMVIYKADAQELAEVDIRTGETLVTDNASYPVYSLATYKDGVLAFEENKEERYIEYIPWKLSTKVTISGGDNVKVGDEAALIAKGDGINTELFSWESSDASVAEVDKNGNLFCWKTGTVTVTLKTPYGVSDQKTVTVKKNTAKKPSKLGSAISKGKATYNIGANNYSRYYADTVKSYLFENSDKTLTRVEYDAEAKNVLVETYSLTGAYKSRKKLKAELDIFGGFYSGKDYNFLVFGRENLKESDKKEVMRVVKYSKNWKRLSAASVKGANTYIPFYSGSLRMTETDGKLYIHTCHIMYADSNGQHHQANMTYGFKQSDMSMLDTVLSSGGFVSHSFNQFIQTDREYIYRVDHGDANPRAFVLTKAAVSDEIPHTKEIELMCFRETGDYFYNITGASAGGFELSTDNCIVAGNAVNYEASEKADEKSTRNIFITVTDKDLEATKTIWFTNYAYNDTKITVYTPQLVKLANNAFLLMWKERNTDTWEDTTKMVTLDGNGQKRSKVVTVKNGPLSDCQPIYCSDNLVKWYVTGEFVGYTKHTAPTLYQIDPFALEKLDTTLSATAKPSKVKGLKIALRTANSVTLKWNKNSSATGYEIQQKVGKKWKTVKTITKNKAVTAKIKKLKKNTSYKFRVRAYKKVGKTKVYGASASITGKTKK